MSLLSEYDNRTAWKYEPIHGVFHTHEGLVSKVNADGSYAPFFASTVVFVADQPCAQAVEKMQTVLHDSLGDMLASPLPVASCHMTLHDLISPEMCVSDPSDGESYRREVDDSLNKAGIIVNAIRHEYAGKKIVMEADRVVNMVSKSLVLLLRPHSESDYELLLDLYRRFDSIVCLPYKLTPHITLAYFRPGMIDGDRLGAAINRVQIQNHHAPSVTFYPEALTAQIFRDMQTYI